VEAPTKRQRVPALSPEERRAALIEATIPLLKEHGLNVSTRQIADAAGVAEGTIFGVFPDKASLIKAAVVAAFDPTATIRKLRSIDPDLGLREKMIAEAEILRDHLASYGALAHVMRTHGLAEAGTDVRVDLMASRFLLLHELAALIEPDSAQLRRNPATAARLLLALTAAPRHGMGDFDDSLDNAEAVVSVILDGLLKRPSSIIDTGDSPC